MKIAFESDLLMPPIVKAISILIDGCEVCVDDIHYDEANGVVEISMQRRELTGFTKSFLGEMKPVYGTNMIKSLLTIRQVDEMKLEVDDRLIADCNSCFTILFGLKADDNQLYLGSVEEAHGNILCQIYINVKRASIEFSDDLDLFK